jgi:DNA-binding transcriptional regulator YiaG
VTSWERGRTKPSEAKRAAIAALASTPAKTRAPKKAQARRVPRKATLKKKPAKPEMSPAAIKAVRKRAGLSQAQMAERLGVSTNTVSNWETDRSKPRAGSLEKLRSM